MPTIRIDDEVYAWLQRQAVPFDDTPNAVLRRLADLDPKRAEIRARRPRMSSALTKSTKRPAGRRSPLATGDELIARWKIPAVQARFHRDGTFYEALTRFPAALCDRNGYVLFSNEPHYRNCPHLHIVEKVNVPAGIWSIEGYRKVNDPV